MRRLWRFIGWFVVVDALITMFGLTTAPLLLSFAADGAIALLLVRSCIEMRAELPIGLDAGAQDGYAKGDF